MAVASALRHQTTVARDHPAIHAPHRPMPRRYAMRGPAVSFAMLPDIGKNLEINASVTTATRKWEESA